MVNSSARQLNWASKAVRALSDKKYEYYKLTKDIGFLKAGAIFYHDPYDDIYGSISEGCLKLCWTPDGNCYSRLAGGTVILHYSFAKSDLFEKIENVTLTKLCDNLEKGRYILDVGKNGDWRLTRQGDPDKWMF